MAGFIANHGGKKENMHVYKRIFDQVCMGLSAVHSLKQCHRDIKPGNIFLQEGKTKNLEDLVAKIGDFGIAKD